MQRYALTCAVLVSLLGTRAAAGQTHSFSTSGLTLQLAADGRVSGLLDTVSGTQRILTLPAFQRHFCEVKQAGVLHAPTGFVRNGNQLEFTFGTLAPAPVVTLGLTLASNHILVRIDAVTNADSLDEVRFVNINNTSGSVSGSILRVLRYSDGRFTGIYPIDPFTRSDIGPAGAGGYLWATAVRGLAYPTPITLSGRAVALFACDTSEAALFAALGQIETANNVPLGAASRAQPGIDRSAIFWMSLPSSRWAQALSIAQQAGVGKMVVWAPIWADVTRSYDVAPTWGATPAERLANLQGFLNQHRAAGIKVGAHVYPSILPTNSYNYLHNGCDPRLRRDRAITLAAPLSASTTTGLIETSTAPLGWPTQPTSQITTDQTTVVIGQEIITYTSLKTDAPPFGFRGPFIRARNQPTLGPQNHAAGATIERLVAIDENFWYEWDLASGGIAQQCTDTAQGINQVGFDFVYADNLEDSEDPEWYLVGLLPYELYARLNPKPAWMEGSGYGAFSWTMLAVSGQIDYNCAANFRSEVDRNVTWMLNPAFDFDVRQLGWARPSCSPVNHISADEFEYLLAKSIAHDAAVTLQLWPQWIDFWPNRDANLFLMNTYEVLRVGNYFPSAVREAAKAPGVDFMLFTTPAGNSHLAQTTRVPIAGDAYQVRGFISNNALDGERYLTIWPTDSTQPQTLYVFGITPADLEVRDYGGTLMSVTPGNGYVAVPVTTREYIRLFPGIADPVQTFSQARLNLSTTPCPGDLNDDRLVDERDLGILLGAWQFDDGGDLNNDGITDQSDLGIFLANWQNACAP